MKLITHDDISNMTLRLCRSENDHKNQAVLMAKWINQLITERLKSTSEDK